MSIFDIFKPAPAPVTQSTSAAPTTPVPGNTATPTGTQQGQQGQQGQQVIEEVKAPLDSFTKLWETDPNAKPTDNSIFGNFDPKTVIDAAKQANFAGLVSQDNLAAIAAGGDAAVKAYQDSLNQVTQAVFAQSTLATTKIIEEAIAANNAKHAASLPELVKRHSASSSLLAENPALSSPAAAPIIKAVEAQIAIKHPNATAAELTSMAKSYLSEFAKTVSPAPKVETKADPAEVDWSKYLDS